MRFSRTVGLLATLPLGAQAPQLQTKDTPAAAQNQNATPDHGQTTTLSVQARLVVVPAVVRDKKGAIVGDLTKENFALTVDGKPQTLRYFDKDNDLPLTVGLLIDISGSQTTVLDDERKASGVFLDKMLASASGPREADKSFIIEFAHTAELLQDVTDSHPKLQQALKDVDQDTSRPSFGNGNGSNNGNGNDPQDNSGNSGSRGRNDHAGTVLYDAVFLASDEIESKQKNRRALVVLTDGDDRGSKENLARSIEAAQRADTVIYAIYYKGENHGGYGNGGGFPGGGGRHGGGFPGGGGGYPGGGGGYPGGGNGGGRGNGGGERVDGKKVLERMCGETGGRMFEVSRKNTLDVIYAQIGEELRQGYRLGFTPSAEAAEEGYHRLNLDLAGPPARNKLNVQTRDGYYTAGK